MGLLVPSSSDLSALADKLGTLVTGAETQEQAVLKSAIDQINDHAVALESKASTDSQTLAAPLIAEIKALRLEIVEWRKIVGDLAHRAIKASAAFGAAGADIVQ